jgi:hypothetical protein
MCGLPAPWRHHRSFNSKRYIEKKAMKSFSNPCSKIPAPEKFFWVAAFVVVQGKPSVLVVF